MRYLLNLLFSFLVITITLYLFTTDSYNEHVLSIGEEKFFNKSQNFSKMGLSQSNKRIFRHDGTRFDLQKNIKDYIILSEVHPANQKNQDEIHFTNVYGTFSRRDDELIISCTGLFKNIYVTSLETKDTRIFRKQVNIKLKASDMNGDVVFPRISNDYKAWVYCLPGSSSGSTLYKSFHERNDLAYFTKFEVSSIDRQIVNFSPGDYLIYSGDSLIEK